jgi:hypothetical protein
MPSVNAAAIPVVVVRRGMVDLLWLRKNGRDRPVLRQGTRGVRLNSICAQANGSKKHQISLSSMPLKHQ